MNQTLVIRLFVLILLQQPLLQAQSIYEDERFINWKSSFHNEQLQATLKLVEGDLTTNKPHPLAAQIWIGINKKLGSQRDIILRAPKSIQKKIVVAYNTSNLIGQEFLSNHPFNTLQQSHDVYALAKGIEAYLDVDPQKAFDLVLHGLEHYGELFIIYQAIHKGLEQSLVFRQIIENGINTDQFSPFPQTKKYLSTLFISQPLSSWAYYRAVEGYLKTFPKDPVAHYFMAELLIEQEKAEQAITHYQLSYEADPFYLDGLPLIKKAAYLWQENQRAEAEATIQAYTNSVHPKQHKLTQKLTKAKALRMIGWCGQAREMLWEINPEYPTNPEIFNELGLVELESGRLSFAADHFHSASKIVPQNSDYYLNRFHANLKAKKYNEALKTIEDYGRTHRHFPLSLYINKAMILSGIDLNEEAISTVKSAIKQYPFSGEAHQMLAGLYLKINQLDQAQVIIKKVFTLQEPNKASIDIFEKILFSLSNQDRKFTVNELSLVATRFSWNEDLLEKITQYKSSDAQRWEIWEKAAKANPELAFPYRRIRDIFLKDQLWDRSIQGMEIAINELDKRNNPYEKGKAHLDRVTIFIQKAKADKLNEQEYSTAKEDLEQYLENWGKPSIYYLNLAELEHEFGNKSQAQKAAAAVIKYQPNDYHCIQLLDSKYGAKSRAMVNLYDWFSRDPYEANRARKFVQFNLERKGSPINALIIMNRYGYHWEELKNQAYTNLGDHTGAFWDNYVRANRLAQDDLKIEMYHQARQKSWENDFEVQMDYLNQEAQITLSDGTVILRKDDLRTGKVKSLKSGLLSMEIDFDQMGRIRNLILPQGKSIQFFYNQSENIEEILNANREKIRIKYDLTDRPTEINWQGKPAIQVSYDDFGKIKAVTGQNTQQAMALYQKVENLLTLPETLNETHSSLLQGTLPDVQFTDQEYEILMSTYARFSGKEKGKGSPIPTLETGIALVNHLFKNSQFSNNYLKKAFAILNDLFRVVEENGETIIVKKQGLKVVNIFYQESLKNFKNGLSRKHWGTWMEMQYWISQEIADPQNNKILQDQLKGLSSTISKKPLQLSASEQLAGKSILNIKSLWEDLLFVPLSSGIKINDLLQLTPSSFLLGTNNGLHVFENNKWQLLEYKPGTKSMVVSDQIPKTNEYNQITDVEMDEQGNIYLGTPKGVLALNAGLVGEVRATINEQSGLPSNLISGLAYQNENFIYRNQQRLGEEQCGWIIRGSATSGCGEPGQSKFCKNLLPII